LKKKKKVKPQNTIKPRNSEDMHIYSCWRKLIDYRTNFFPWLLRYCLQIFFSWNRWRKVLLSRSFELDNSMMGQAIVWDEVIFSWDGISCCNQEPGGGNQQTW
jgi:hypothetical protein